jgi:hypothetical protein
LPTNRLRKDGYAPFDESFTAQSRAELSENFIEYAARAPALSALQMGSFVKKSHDIKEIRQLYSTIESR